MNELSQQIHGGMVDHDHDGALGYGYSNYHGQHHQTHDQCEVLDIEDSQPFSVVSETSGSTGMIASMGVDQAGAADRVSGHRPALKQVQDDTRPAYYDNLPTQQFEQQDLPAYPTIPKGVDSRAPAQGGSAKDKDSVEGTGTWWKQAGPRDTAMPTDSTGSMPREWLGMQQPSPPSAPPWVQQPQAERNSRYSANPPAGSHQDTPRAPESAPSKLISMRRHEAWARFAAYEGCIQVCLADPADPNSQAFQKDGFSKLRDDLSIGSLLLSPASQPDAYTTPGYGGPATHSAAPDICWEDLDSLDMRLGANAATVQPASNGGTHLLRVRVARLHLPGPGMLGRLKRWAIKRSPGTAVSGAANNELGQLVVYGSCTSPAGTAVLKCPLDSKGLPVMQGYQQQLVLGHEFSGADVHFEVTSQEGTCASASLQFKQLWSLVQQVEVVEEGGVWGTGEDIPCEIGNRFTVTTRLVLEPPPDAPQGVPVELTIMIQRLHRPAQEVELAASSMAACNLNHGQQGQGPHVGAGMTGNGSKGQTMRLNAYAVYDYTLKAALSSEQCGARRLQLTGPWRWLLFKFADMFGVRPWYSMLVHLQWVLDPSVATHTTECFLVVRDSLQYLLRAEREGALTENEISLLSRCTLGAERLLQGALENYHTLGHIPGEPPAPGMTSNWDAGAQHAAMELFREVSHCLKPSAKDWLALRFLQAAKTRWGQLRGRCTQGDPAIVWELLKGKTALEDTQSNEMCMGPLDRRRNANMRAINNPATQVSPAQEGKAVAVYQTLCQMCAFIKEDISFDIQIMALGCLPEQPYLPRCTAEEYCSRFLEVLRAALSAYPPATPSPPAVNLLVAVAEMQRTLEAQGLNFEVHHPGRVDAFQLFKPHVLNWINATQAALTKRCQQLEGTGMAAPLQGSPMGMPRNHLGEAMMLNAIPGGPCPLVNSMASECTRELTLYERVIQHWPQFAPPLEAAMCRVVRSTLGALTRQCQMTKGTATTDGSASSGHSPGMQGHATIASPHNIGTSSGSKKNGPAASMFGKADGTAQMGPLTSRSQQEAARRHTMYHMGPGGAAGQGQQGSPAAVPRTAVLLKEAVLLNSLKHLMVLVPNMENMLRLDCASQAPGSAHMASSAAASPPRPLSADDMAVGAQFAQVVKELRTEYAGAVALCAGRLSDILRTSPTTNIKIALSQPVPGFPPADMISQNYAAPQQVSSANAQRAYVEDLMAPIVAAVTEALAALRAALDVRVYVATGRALWDYVGKDLYEFVEGLSDSEGRSSHSRITSAWRARQHASMALDRLDATFRDAFTTALAGSAQARDLKPPAHADRAHKLLERSDTAANMNFSPF